MAFALRLARDMGIPLGELMERMTGEEMGLHWAQYRAQPWGPERDEVHAAMIARTVANMAGKMVKDPLSLTTFLTYSRPPEPEIDPLEWAKQNG